MANEFWASPDELDKLTNPPVNDSPTAAPLNIPDPEPEILERAQQILDGLNKGEAFSTQTDKPATPELTEEQRLRFVAHIMQDDPYCALYMRLNDRVQVKFSTITADTEDQLTRLVMQQESRKVGTPADRNARYTNYLMWTSLLTLTFDNVVRPYAGPGKFKDLESIEIGYADWLSTLNREQYRLILDCFNQFEQEVQDLLARVNDPSFWPTL